MMKTLHLTLLCLLTCTAAKASFVEEETTHNQKSARLWEQYLTDTVSNAPEIRSAASIYQEASRRAQDLARHAAEARQNDAYIKLFELR